MHHPRSRLKKQNVLVKTKHHVKHLKKLGWKGTLLYFIKRYQQQIFWGFGILVAIMLLIPIFTYIYFASDLKDKESITSRSKTGLTLMDDEGKTFFTFYQPKEVTYIPLSDISKNIQEAVIAAEDRNFYTNPGFSITGIGRAFIRNILAGQIVEGGSTISQELVKIALLNSERTVFRKYQEVVLATELNRRFTKDDILEMYLNSVYFGEGAFGIENAAQAYFGIPAKDLSLGQSALLIGLLPAPSAYSPLSNDPEIALKKQRQVLNALVEEKYITRAQADEAASTPMVYNPLQKQGTNILAPHFALYVRDYLIDKYGEERLIREGFKVKTTLHRPWQEYAEQAVKNQISYLQRNNATNGSAVAIDPKTGEIKVMVGSYDWDDESFGTTNMTLVPRQPGSSFKPIIYADALEKKLITPATLLKDEPIEYGSYKPENYDKTTRGEVTVRRALANSLNIPAVEVMNMVGVSSGLRMARNLGITTLGNDAKKYGLSLVLGSGEVRLLELTNAYAVFADQGVYHPTTPIIEIKNKYDKVVDTKPNGFFSFFTNIFAPITNFFTGSTSTTQERIALSDDTAYLISSILSDNRARAEEFGGALTISRQAAVKTGTTNDYRDALTVGYTPSLVVGVWVGNNDNTPMDNIAGSLGAAPIWRNLMNTFLAGTPLESFIKPASIVSVQLCATPGTVVASGSAVTEYFIRGTEPVGCTTPTPQPTNRPTDTPTPTPNGEPTKAQDQPTATPTPTVAQNTPTPTQAAVTPTNIIPTTPLLP